MRALPVKSSARVTMTMAIPIGKTIPDSSRATAGFSMLCDTIVEANAAIATKNPAKITNGKSLLAGTSVFCLPIVVTASHLGGFEHIHLHLLGNIMFTIIADPRKRIATLI